MWYSIKGTKKEWYKMVKVKVNVIQREYAFHSVILVCPRLLLSLFGEF